MFSTSSKSHRLLIILLSTAFMVACIPTTAVPTPIPPTNTMSVPTDTAIPPTFTLVPPPTSTNTQIPPTQTRIPVSETPSSGQQMMLIYLVAIDDNGTSGKLIGCGDSLVPVEVLIKPTSGVLRAALNALLSIRDQFYGLSGLYNALYQSSLQIGDVSIVDGQAIIHLTGTIMMGGECDIPRVEAQLTEIALQFSTVNSVSVYINDVPLKDYLSLK